MARVFSVRWMMDDCDVISGSDDGNVRQWKARASEKLGHTTGRERAKFREAEALKNAYQHVPEIRRILKYVPHNLCCPYLILFVDIANYQRKSRVNSGLLVPKMPHKRGRTKGVGNDPRKRCLKSIHWASLSSLRWNSKVVSIKSFETEF